MSHKNATRFQSEHSGQRHNHAQKSNGSRGHQPNKPNTPSSEPMNIVDRSVLRSGLSYDSFVRLLIQSALSRLTIWTQADLDRLLMLSERLGLDPLNNEIYATEVSQDSGKKARIVFVVGVVAAGVFGCRGGRGGERERAKRGTRSRRRTIARERERTRESFSLALLKNTNRASLLLTSLSWNQ